MTCCCLSEKRENSWLDITCETNLFNDNVLKKIKPALDMKILSKFYGDDQAGASAASVKSSRQ